MSDDPRDTDYFRGYRAHKPHPHSPSTGSEGRCDICSGYADDRNHERPWTRLTLDEYRAEQERNLVRMIPLEAQKPQFHNLGYDARQSRIDAIPVKSGWEPLLSAAIPKEVPPTMRIALTVEVPDLMAYARLVNTIQDEGATVITANMAPTPEEAPKPAIRRRIAVDVGSIRDLIDYALAQDDTPEVEITYRSLGDLVPTTRRIVPVHWNSNGHLGAIDKATGNYKQYAVNGDQFKRAEIR